MKCTKCGLEYDDNLYSCPNCRTLTSIMPSLSLNPASDKVNAMLNDVLFLIICILMSVSAVCGILGGGALINILFTIFLWLAYSQSRSGIISSTHLRSISGTFFAGYVINFVFAGLLGLVGLLFGLLFLAAGYIPDISDEIASSTEINNFISQEVFEKIAPFLAIIITLVFILGAVLIIVINIFGYGKIHSLIQSVYKSIDMNNIDFKNANTAKIWLFIFGAINILSALAASLTSIVSALVSGCTGLCMIFGGVLISKYLTNE